MGPDPLEIVKKNIVRPLLPQNFQTNILIEKSKCKKVLRKSNEVNGQFVPHHRPTFSYIASTFLIKIKPVYIMRIISECNMTETLSYINYCRPIFHISFTQQLALRRIPRT